jgi:outer membrane protein OmpA-like peptidoglycan-associated protein/Tol biopolymer transport system component
MKYAISLLVCLILVLSTYAQQYDPAKVSKKARNLYDQAIQKADDGKLRDALDLLYQALESSPAFVDAMLSRAGIFGEMKKYPEAIAAYERAFSADPEYTAEFYLPYAINLAGNGEFDKALVAINKFLAVPGLNESSLKAGQFRKKNIEFAINYKKSTNPSYVFNPVNAGDGVNTSNSEYFPSLTIDGSRLVFTRRVDGGLNEDFFSTELQNSEWKTAKPLPGEINTPLNEGGQQITQDGKWLVYTGCNFPDGFGSCDLYISYLTSSGWGARQNLGQTINTESWESTPCISPDKNELYFSSNRPGGYGGSDIYVSKRLANGRWASPENLGAVINTAGDESSPYMHADNETMYFSSSGLQGYGGTDIFITKKGIQGFSKPINAGYPINTIDNEGSLVVSSGGVKAFYASDRADSKGGLDIYSFDLREDLRPLPTSWVQGRIADTGSGNGLQATVEVVDIKTGRVIFVTESDQDGNYLATLPVGRNYSISINKKGYLFHSGNFMLAENKVETAFKVNIPLQPITKGANIILRNIFFPTAKFDLLPESITELDKVVTLMRDNPSLHIEIRGHTDNVGKDSDNMVLSTSRAKSVVEYLVSKGVVVARLTFKGLGASTPVADNTTEEGRALNRRTEMMIVSNN